MIMLPPLLAHAYETKARRLFLHRVVFPPFRVLVIDTPPDPLTPYFESIS